MSRKAREGFANSICVARKLRIVYTDCHMANRAENLKDGYLGTAKLPLFFAVRILRLEKMKKMHPMVVWEPGASKSIRISNGKHVYCTSAQIRVSFDSRAWTHKLVDRPYV